MQDARYNANVDPEKLLRLYPDAVDAEGKLIRELHGVTLAAIVEVLVERFGWEELANRIPINCFLNDPSIKSSLTFLRRTPWARTKVERLYMAMRTADVVGLRL